MTKIKPNSWEHYLHLLNTFDFDLDVSKITKEWIIKKHNQDSELIEKLRLIYDQRNELYNQFNPRSK